MRTIELARPNEPIAGPTAPERAGVIHRQLIRMRMRLLQLNIMRVSSFFIVRPRMARHVRMRVLQLRYLMEVYEVLEKRKS